MERISKSVWNEIDVQFFIPCKDRKEEWILIKNLSLRFEELFLNHFDIMNIDKLKLKIKLKNSNIFAKSYFKRTTETTPF